LIVTVVALGAPVAAGPTPDALHRRTLADLKVFTDWLAANNADGFVGEIGWPDDVHGDATKWNGLAEDWYDAADAAGLWTAYWATGEWWHTDYLLAAYEDRNNPEGVDSPNTQATVLEAHPSTTAYSRGIVDAGGDFCGPSIDPTSTFSNKTPGRYDRCYHYDNQATFDYIASRGYRFLKIEFRWEPIQRKPGEPLDPKGIERLASAVARARSAGLQVILDLHNFGAYYMWNGTEGVRRPVGSRKVSIANFADFWRRLSETFKDDPGVFYALMCEPVEMKGKGDLPAAGVWEKASQAALDAIRSNGDNKLVLVAGYRWSPAADWDKIHDNAWIADPANNFLYEAHHYWDRDQSGRYFKTYDEEVAWAEEQGY
jgi:hypothetical protein